MTIYNLLIVALFLVSVKAAPWTSCGNMNSLVIAGCLDSADICEVQRGSEFAVNGTFTPTQSVSNTDRLLVKADAWADDNPNRQAHLQNANGNCPKFFRSNCPITAGTAISFTNKIRIPQKLPATQGTLEMKLLAGEAAIACARIRVKTL